MPSVEVSFLVKPESARSVSPCDRSDARGARAKRTADSATPQFPDEFKEKSFAKTRVSAASAVRAPATLDNFAGHTSARPRAGPDKGSRHRYRPVIVRHR